jgi:hypothetical protein
MMAPRMTLASFSSAKSGASPHQTSGSHSVARQHQFRPDRNPGEEAVEIGQRHAVWRRAVGHQEAVKHFQIDLVDEFDPIFWAALSSSHFRQRAWFAAEGFLSARVEPSSQTAVAR